MNSGPPSVLVVDDDAVIREAVRRSLEPDYSIVEGSTLAEARRFVDEGLGCALVDYRLPDGSGLDLVPELVDRAIPVLVLTGMGNETVAVDAMKLGCEDYLTKAEMTPQLLVRVVGYAIERARTRAKRVLEHQELRSFVSTAAHDLQAPMRHIRSFCTLAREALDDEEPGQVRAYLDRVTAAAERLTGLTRALLEYTKLGASPGRSEPVDLDQVVSQLVAEMEPTLGQLEGRVEWSGLPTVLGDEHLLTQLFQNLLGNAVKFRSNAPPHITLKASRSDALWTIAITDNGIGIDERFLDAVFLPLRQLQGASDDGFGIGLATCRRIVDKHGGKIWVRSTPGRGSTFFVTLPDPGST